MITTSKDKEAVRLNTACWTTQLQAKRPMPKDVGLINCRLWNLLLNLYQ